MSDIEQSWRRIAASHKANVPEEILVLAEGAGEDQILAFESEVGFRLPEDLRVSFAVHNGASNEGFLLHHGELLSLEKIAAQYAMHRGWQRDEGWGTGPDYRAKYIDGPIKPVWWNSSRLALTDNSGDAIMADFDPAEGGSAGQVITFDHEVGPRRVLAPSFGQWLRGIADGLENGEYICYPDESTVAPPDMGW